MGAVPDGAEAVQGGDSESACEISVGAAACGALAEGKIHLLCERLRAGKERRGDLTFKRGAVEAAGNFQFCPFMDRAQRVEAAFDAAYVGISQGPQIQKGASAFRNHVGAGAAFDDVGVDADAAAGVVPLFDARELRSQFVDGVDAFFRREASVGSAALHDEFRLTNAFARGLQQAARAEGRLEDEDDIAAARFGFDQFSRRFAANFLVGGPEKDDSFMKADAKLLARMEREKGLD